MLPDSSTPGEYSTGDRAGEGSDDNILKRLLIHGGGFNLVLAMRQCLGSGTPRRLQGRAAGVLAVFIAGWARLGAFWGNHEPRFVDRLPWSSPRHCFELLPVAKHDREGRMMDQAIHNKIVSFIRGIEANLGSRSHLTPDSRMLSADAKRSESPRWR